MRFKTELVVGVTLAWMLFAQPAFAATVRSTPSGQAVIYEAGPGEINTVSIVPIALDVIITDLTAPIVVETTKCVAITPNQARCDYLTHVRTGDGADSVEVTNRSVQVDAGPGNDTLTGTGRNSGITLAGGEGDDRIVGQVGGQALDGGPGEDSLDGGPDHDNLRGGPGNDSLAGGPGGDSVDYSDHTTPVTITLDGRANDGAAGAGELDWIHADVEDAWGSQARTIFIGNAGPNFFGGSDVGDLVRTGGGDDFVLCGQGPDVVYGQGGDDSISGYGGRDVLSGGPGDDGIGGNRGADLILGGRGNDGLGGDRGADDLRGGGGDDRLRGGYENDTLRGGPGRDRLRGNWGRDVFYARDRSRDEVDGGRGTDRAHVDLIDVLLRVEVRF